MQLLNTEKIPGKYYKQMQFQMWISGKEWVDFISYAKYWPLSMPGSQMKIIRVYRNEDLISDIEESTWEFLQDVEKLVKKIGGENA